jgi:hypothetical protein
MRWAVSTPGQPAKLCKELGFGDTLFRKLASRSDACEYHVPKVRRIQWHHLRFGSAR